MEEGLRKPNRKASQHGDWQQQKAMTNPKLEGS